MPTPNIDPERSNRRATEQLTKQIEALNHHLVSMEQPTMASYLRQQQMASEVPGTITTPEALQAKFVSWAAPATGTPSSQDPGGIGKYASVGSAPEEGTMRQKESAERLRMQELSGIDESPRSEVLPSMTENEVTQTKRQRLEIPQYKWRLDSILNASRDMAVKMATKENEAGEIEPREGRLAEMARTAIEGQGQMPGLSKALEYAAPAEFALHQTRNMAGGVMRQAYAGQEVGASLGYSPQTGVGGAYILGMRNPLAALTSEAGKQGIGQRLGAIGATLSGGIGMEQAAGLREGLSAEGFSNQNEGLFGMYTGGENENLAQALEGPVKEGMKGSVAAGFANVTRYGNANIKQLSKALEGLGSVSKALKQTIDQTGESMQKYAKEMEGQGALPLHSLNTYKELARTTGLQPELLNQVGESQLGQAAQMRSGMFPGILGSRTAQGQLGVAKKTVEMAQGYYPGQAQRRWNGHEWEEESAEENKYAMWQKVFGIDPSTARAIVTRGPQMEKAMHLEKGIKTTLERFNSPAHAQLEEKGYLEHHTAESKRAEDLQNQIDKERYTQIQEEHGKIPTKLGEEGMPTRGKLIEGHEAEQKALQNKIAAHGKQGALGRGMEATEWGKMWPAAAQAGIQDQEFKELWLNAKGNPEAAFKGLQSKLSEKSKISTEQEEGKTVVELSPTAKKFFEIADPEAFKTNTNAGGPSGSSVSALANQPGIPAATAQAIKKVNETAVANRSQFSR